MAKQKNNIATLNAKEALYGHSMTKAKASRLILMYEIGVLAFTGVLYGGPHGIFPIAFWMIITALYVYFRILPRQVNANYYRRGMVERNRFINIVTQGMTTHDANIISVLTNASTKINGEFGDEVKTLLATLMSSNDYNEQHDAFLHIQNKYNDDIYFVLFMEQVETTFHESTYHIATFQTFKNSHNTLLLKRKKFIRQKRNVQQQMIVMLGVSLVTDAVCCLSNGWNDFIKVYATTVPGIIITTVYLFIVGFIVNGFYKRFFDDNITSY